jgi:hypothetical protein
MSTFLHQYRKLSYDEDSSILSEIISRVSSLESSENQLEPIDREKIAFIKTIEEGLIFREYPCYQTHYSRRDQELYSLALEPDKLYTKYMFKFDHRSSTMEDASLFQNDILMENFPKLSVFHPTIPNYSCRFDGNDDYFQIAHGSDLIVKTWTISFWFKPETNDGAEQQFIFQKGINSNGTFDPTYVYISLNETSQDITVQYKSSTNTITLFPALPVSEYDKWHHILVTYGNDGSGLGRYILRVYLDGVLEETSSFSTSLGELQTTDDIFLSYPKQTPTFKGFIDELFIFNRQLDDYEIQQMYEMDSSLNIQIEGCILWHGFNGGNRDLLTDIESFNTNLPFIKDMCGFHTGEFKEGAFFDTDYPTQFGASFKWRDFMYDTLPGHKLNGTIGYRIPEKNNDLKLTNKAAGGISIWIMFMIKTFNQMNGRYQTLFTKIDDENGNYSYRAYIGQDQKFYFFAKWNGVEKGVRTKKKFPSNQLLNVVFAIDGVQLSNPAQIDYSQALKISVNGFYMQVEPPTVTGGLPSSGNKTTDFDFLLVRTWESFRGYLQDDAMIFYSNFYGKALSSDEVLHLATNFRTISDIPLGHVAELDIMLLQDDSDPKFTRGDDVFIIPQKFDKANATYNTDANPTARAVDVFDWDNSNSPEGANKEVVVTTWNPLGAPPTNQFSVFFDNDDEQHIDTDVIEPIRDKFSISVWIKFLGLKFGADFGCIVSQLDKMKGGNRLMVNATTIRWHGQFLNDNNRWNDERVTVPNIQGAWHHIVVTHDGDKKDEFKIYLDAQLVYEAEIDGHVQQGEGKRREDESHIGKGESGQDDEDAFFFYGYIDKLLVKKIAMDQTEINRLYAKLTPDPKNMLCYYEFEKTAKDLSDNDIDGKLRHGAEYSTDIP